MSRTHNSDNNKKAGSTLAVKYKCQLPRAVVAAINIPRINKLRRRGDNTAISTITPVQIEATLKPYRSGSLRLRVGRRSKAGSLSLKMSSGTELSSFVLHLVRRQVRPLVHLPCRRRTHRQIPRGRSQCLVGPCR